MSPSCEGLSLSLTGDYRGSRPHAAHGKKSSNNGGANGIDDRWRSGRSEGAGEGKKLAHQSMLIEKGGVKMEPSLAHMALLSAAGDERQGSEQRFSIREKVPSR